MTSYIKFIFKYLFEPETLSAELLSAADSNSSSPEVFAAPNSSSSVSLTIINKSSGSPAWSSLTKLTLVGQRPAASDWLWLQQRQQPAAEHGGKLWPSKCLGFVRLFAMAQGNATSGGGGGEATAHGGSAQLGQLSSPTPNSLLVRLGSFAEFEHLIRQQLAAGPFRAGTNPSSDSNNNNNINNTNNSDSQQNNNNNSHWQRPGRQTAHTTSPGADSLWPPARHQPASDAASPLTGWRSPKGLLRLLIRSIEAEPQDAGQPTGPKGATPAATGNWSLAGVELSGGVARNGSVSSGELLDCYRGLQLAEYHQNYDIYIGLRIASTLTILFVVFILFVIYKTGCRDGDRPSRSQLRLTSASGQPTAKPRAIDASRRPQRGRTRRAQKEERADWRPPDWPSGWPRRDEPRRSGAQAPAPEPEATN